MFDTLTAPVGNGQPNESSDVRQVRDGLNVWLRSRGDGAVLFDRGWFDSSMEQALRMFQRQVMKNYFSGGIVRPRDATAGVLCELAKASATGNVPLHLPPRSGYDELTLADYQAVADKLGCEVNVVRALGVVEGKGKGFDRRNRPVLLFEPWQFNQYTVGRYRGLFPDLTITPNPYGTDDRQWALLEAAYYLNSEAALRAASWGQFQILGDSHRQAGYASVSVFVNTMCANLQNQIAAFYTFCTNKDGLQEALRLKD